VTQLTSDSGLSGFSALSPDGKLVAYSAESGVNGERDLYVRQLAEGQPVRLTFDGAVNTTPDFSPDGAKIVFRSNRDGGGIYEIPALGGDVRLIAPGGLNPRYSPDGSQIAYWVGAGGVVVAVPGAGAIWVAPVAGGRPRQVGSSFTSARFPIWAPDGKHLLVAGYTSPKAYDASAIDWWVVDSNTGHAVRTGASGVLARAGLQTRDSGSIPAPGCWSAGDNTVISSIRSGDVQNLWGIGLSPQTGKVNGELKRLTMGAGNEVWPSCGPGGVVAFTRLETTRDLWALPFDLDRESARGPLERITNSPAIRYYVSLSGNGHYAAFAAESSGQSAIWLRDLASGKETRVAGSSLLHRYPVVDFSGSRVLYSVYEKEKRVVYVSAPGGAPEKVCEGCLRATDWSRDEKTILVYGGDPYQIDVLNLAARQQTPLLKHPTYKLLYGRFSPDNRWVSFTARVGPDRSRIAIAPVDGPKPIPESAWIDIAEARYEDWANWSPDGKTLYFTSDRDGNRCLWGQRIDPISHRPAGEPFAARHLHGRVSYRTAGWDAAAGRIAMVLFEETGNVWMISPPAGTDARR
jgi:Tol biopolymer transport system component